MPTFVTNMNKFEILNIHKHQVKHIGGEKWNELTESIDVYLICSGNVQQVVALFALGLNFLSIVKYIQDVNSEKHQN